MKDVKLAVNHDALRLLHKINQLLAAEGVPAYLVGGFLRDWLLGRETADIDIAVGAEALAVARKIAAALGGKYIPLDAENGIGRVVISGETCHFDFSTIGGDIQQDLGRRDFTINAMALPLDESFGESLDSARLIDPFGGRDDLDHRILKVTNPGVFAADAVRLLRAVRIAGELGLCIERLTETRLRHCSQLVTTVAGERVREELLRLLALPGAARRLAYLDGLGLLTALVPELGPARGVVQPRLHVWDVFNHSLQTVAAAEFVLREGDWDFAGAPELAAVPWSPALEEHFGQEISSGSTRRVLLKIAALLHDIAKPETKTTDESGRTRFLGHPRLGADTAAAILARLRFSHREIQHVALLVKYHLRPTQMSHEGTPTRRAVYRYFRDTGATGIDLLFLSLADHLATRGADLDRQQWRAHTRLTGDVLQMYFEEKSSPETPRLIDGHDLMNTFGLRPGPHLGRLLEAVREAQAVGEVTDRQGAISFVKRLMKDVADPEKN